MTDKIVQRNSASRLTEIIVFTSKLCKRFTNYFVLGEGLPPVEERMRPLTQDEIEARRVAAQVLEDTDDSLILEKWHSIECVC